METYIIFVTILFTLMIIDHIFNSSNVKVSQNGMIIQLNHLNRMTVCKLLFVFIIFFFSAARYGVGWDYWAYYDMMNSSDFFLVNSREELLSLYLMELVSNIEFPELFFIITSFILVMFITLTVLTYSSDFWVSMLFFVFFPLFYLNSFSVVRNFTAIAISFYGLKYIINKEFVKYFMVIFAASLFHFSASIAIILYFFKDFRIKPYHIAFLIIISVPLSELLIWIITTFFPTYSGYTLTTEIQEGTRALYFFILLMVLSTWYMQKMNVQDKIINIAYNNFVVGTMFYVLFANQGTLGHRASIFGTIYSILLVPLLLNALKAIEMQIIIRIGFYVICLVMFFYTLYVGSDTYIPYKVFW